jgi:hypothetical protein
MKPSLSRPTRSRPRAPRPGNVLSSRAPAVPSQRSASGLNAPRDPALSRRSVVQRRVPRGTTSIHHRSPRSLPSDAKTSRQRLVTANAVPAPMPTLDLERRREGDPVGERIGRVAAEQGMLLMLCDQCALERCLAEGEIGSARSTGTVAGCGSGAFPTCLRRWRATRWTMSSRCERTELALGGLCSAEPRLGEPRPPFG